MAVVVISTYRRLLDRAVHALDLAVGLGVVGLGQAVIDVVTGAGDFKGVGAKMLSTLLSQLDVGGGRTEVARGGEVSAVVGENGVDFIRDELDEFLQKIGGLAPSRPFHQSGEGELAGAVDGDKKVELTLGGAHLGEIDVEVADQIDLELLLGRTLAVEIRPTADAVALKTTMRRGSGELGDGRLQGIEAIIQPQ